MKVRFNRRITSESTNTSSLKRTITDDMQSCIPSGMPSSSPNPSYSFRGTTARPFLPNTSSAPSSVKPTTLTFGRSSSRASSTVTKMSSTSGSPAPPSTTLLSGRTRRQSACSSSRSRLPELTSSNPLLVERGQQRTSRRRTTISSAPTPGRSRCTSSTARSRGCSSFVTHRKVNAVHYMHQERSKVAQRRRGVLSPYLRGRSEKC